MDYSALFQFLTGLEKNNNKEWFAANKPNYQQQKNDFENLVNDTIRQVAAFDETVDGLEPKKCIFRLHRDVRFSPNKTPYKTNFGASITRDGRKSGNSGYYMHLEPGGKSMIAAGVYMPQGENLKKVRQEIDYNADEFKAILNDKNFKKAFPTLELQNDKLKTAPRGYPKDHPELELLRNKHFIVSKVFTDKEVIDGTFEKEMIRLMKLVKPFNDFLNRAIND